MSIIDEGLKALIKKSSSTRLISELKIAQNLLDADTLRELSRTDLVSYVYHLRQLAGQKTPLKDIVPDFKLENVFIFQETDGDAEEGPTTPTTVSAPILPSDPGISTLLIYLMNKEAADKAAAKEDRRLEREALEAKEAAERTRLEAKEEAAKEDRRLEREAVEAKEAAAKEDRRLEREALVAKEAAERTRLEKKEAAEQTRLKKGKRRQSCSP